MLSCRFERTNRLRNRTLVCRYVYIALTTLLLIHSIVFVQSKSTDTRNKIPGTADVSQYRPRNVLLDILNSTSVHLRWEEPKDTPPSCPVTRYNIRLKTEGAKRSRTWKIDATRRSVTLHDLQSDSTYYVRLLAITCEGKGRPSRWIRVRTLEGVDQGPVAERQQDLEASESRAPAKPTYVRTRTFPDSVIVSWLIPDDGILIRGYMVGYGEGVPDVNWQYVEAGRSNVTIKNLKPATQYIISLRAFNNMGKGPVVHDLIYTRELPPSTVGPSAPPTDLKAKVLSPTTAWLQWVDPSLGRLQQLTDTRYYNVHYQPLPNPGPRTDPDLLLASGGETDDKSLSVIVKALHVVLYDLRPGTRYEFKVRTVKDSQASPFSEPVVNKTFETAPASAPRNLNILSTNSSTVALAAWRPSKQPNGDIMGYLLMYTQSPDLPIIDWQIHSVPGNTTEAVVSNLWPNKTYHFKIQCKNSKGYSPFSETVTHFTAAREDDLHWVLPSYGRGELSQELGGVNHSLSVVFNKDTPIEGGAIRESTYRHIDNNDGRVLGDDGIPRAQRLQQSLGLGQRTGNQVESSALLRGDDVHLNQNEVRATSNMTSSSTSSNYSSSASGRESATRESKGSSVAGVGDRIRVPFSTVIHHRVSAYITWPEQLEGCGHVPAGSGPLVDTADPIVGYTLRWWLDATGGRSENGRRVDEDRNLAEGKSENRRRGDEIRSGERNLTVNMIVLDDLLPYRRYMYSVRYRYQSGVLSPWSQDRILDTSAQQ